MKRLCLFLTISSFFVDFFDEMVGRFPKTNNSETDPIGGRFLSWRLYSGRVEDFQCSP